MPKGASLSKKGKGKKKKGDVGDAAEFDDIIKHMRTLIQRELGSRDVDTHPLLVQMAKYEEKEIIPKQLIFAYPMEQLMVAVITHSIISSTYTGVHSLCFWNSAIGDTGAEHLSTALPLLPCIKKLEIRDSELTAQGCFFLAQALAKDKQNFLQILRLDHNPIGNDGVAHLSDGLTNNNTLRILSLAFCDIKSDGGNHLAKILTFSDIRLLELNLDGNDLRSAGLMALSRGLRRNGSLTKLNLASNKLGDDIKVIDALSRAFKKNPKLTKINLDGNLIGNDGCKHFIESLNECKHIVEFEVTPFVNPINFRLLQDWVDGNKPKPKKKKSKKKKKKKTW